MVAISTFFPNASFRLGAISDVSTCIIKIDDDDGDSIDDEAATDRIVFFLYCREVTERKSEDTTQHE